MPRPDAAWDAGGAIHGPASSGTFHAGRTHGLKRSDAGLHECERYLLPGRFQRTALI